LAHIGLKLPCYYAEEPSAFVRKVRFIRQLYYEYNHQYQNWIKDCRKYALLQYDKKVIVDKLERMFEEVSRR